MKFHNFDDTLKEGNICEEHVKEQFKVIFEPILHHIMFDANPDKQRAGIDFEVERKPLSFDVKCRNAYALQYGDILLETISIVENATAGWLYTSTSDIVVYLWKNLSGTRFLDGYLLMLPQIRTWLCETDNSYPVKKAHSQRNGRIWTTENIAAPIKDFPKECITHINRDKLNPTQQTLLQNWFV